MIIFNYETDFLLENEKQYLDWISKVIVSEDKQEGEVNYIFCDDEYLLQINQQYLNRLLYRYYKFRLYNRKRNQRRYLHFHRQSKRKCY